MRQGESGQLPQGTDSETARGCRELGPRELPRSLPIRVNASPRGW